MDKPRLSGPRLAEILAILVENGTATSAYLEGRLGLSQTSVGDHLRGLRLQGRAYILRYDPHHCGGGFVPVWTAGQGTDAVNPHTLRRKARASHAPRVAAPRQKPPAKRARRPANRRLTAESFMRGVGTRFVGGVNPWTGT